MMVNDVEKLLLNVLDTYKDAVLVKDAKRFISLYAPDVRVFDMWGTWSYEDSKAWLIAVESWFSSLGNDSVRVTFEDVKTVVEQGIAAMSAIVTYIGVSAEGQEIRAMQNRISWVLKISGTDMLITHEHTSAPIEFEDTKAILKRR